MTDFDIRNLPFLTRKMLSFEGSSQFLLRLTVQSTAESNVVVRGATKDGTFSFLVTPVSDKAPQNFDLGISDVPIWVSVLDAENGYLRGMLYVTLKLVVNGDELHQLASGYVYGQSGVTFPVTGNVESTPQFGFFDTITTNNPNAGSNINYTVPAYTYMRLRGASFSMTTSSTVANRRVQVAVSQAGGAKQYFLSAYDHAASDTVLYSLVPTGATATTTGDGLVVLPIPQELILPPGTLIETEVELLQSGDNLTAMSLFVEQWLQIS